MGIVKSNIINIKETTKEKKKVRFKDQENKNKIIFYFKLLLILLLFFCINQDYIQLYQITKNYIIYILSRVNILIIKSK
jgi:uncharacterized integral membrane protein